MIKNAVNNKKQKKHDFPNLQEHIFFLSVSFKNDVFFVFCYLQRFWLQIMFFVIYNVFGQICDITIANNKTNMICFQNMPFVIKKCFLIGVAKIKVCSKQL